MQMVRLTFEQRKSLEQESERRWRIVMRQQRQLRAEIKRRKARLKTED
jgi:hypothetical protein